MPKAHSTRWGREQRKFEREFRQAKMYFLCAASRLSVGLGYGDLRALRAADSRYLDADGVRGLDDVTARLLDGGEGVGFLGSDPQAAEERLFEMLLTEPWPWWANWSPRKLAANARKSWQTRKGVANS